MHDIRHGQIGGLPTVWIPGPAPTMAGLVFRVGQADEPLAWRGSSHLIEHLALSGLDELYSFNGQVGTISTMFFARGSQAEVSGFLQHVVDSLAQLPYDRLDAEARILRTEAAGHGGALSQAWGYLYGATGLGVTNYQEMILEQPTADRLERWRTTWFNQSNAAVWVVGPETVNVDFTPLPAGQRFVPPAPVPVVPWPQSYSQGYNGRTVLALSLIHI